MTREKDLAKNTAILFIGSLCTKIAQFLLLPLYTGILTTAEYGSVELANTIVSLLLPLIGLQIEYGIFRFLIDVRNDKTKTNEMVSTAFFFMLFCDIICIIGFLCVSPFITYEFKWLVLITLIANSLSSFVLQTARGLGDNKSFAVSGFLSAVIAIIANIIFLVGLHFRAEGLLYGNIIGYLASVLYLFFKLGLFKKISTKYFNKKLLKRLLKYSVPVMLNSISWWIFSSSDRVIISWFLGLSATGILSIVYKFSSISIIVYNIFYMSLAESVALHVDDEDFPQFFHKAFTAISHLFTNANSLIIVAMPIVFSILVHSSYNEAFNLIPIAIIAAVLQVYVGLFSTIYTAKKQTSSIAVTSTIAAIVNIVIDLALVNFVGIYAAVISTVASYAVLAIYRYIHVNKKFIKVRIDKKMALNFTIAICICSGIYYIDNIYVKIINILLACCCAIYFNMNNMKFILNIVKEKTKKEKK